MAEDGAIEMVLFSAGRVVARTSERFIGTTLDVWRADDPAYGEKWGNASAPGASAPCTGARTVARAAAYRWIAAQDPIAYESIGGACPPLGDRFDDLRRRKRRCAMLDHDPARCLASRWGKLRCWHREGRCRTVNWWAERYPTQPPQRGSGRTPRRLSTEAAAPSIAAAASERPLRQPAPWPPRGPAGCASVASITTARRCTPTRPCTTASPSRDFFCCLFVCN